MTEKPWSTAASSEALNSIAILLLLIPLHDHYPWLEDPAQISFRYGNYNSIRRSYLPQDYRRDTAHVHVVQTVHGMRPFLEIRRNDLAWRAVAHVWIAECVCRVCRTGRDR